MNTHYTYLIILAASLAGPLVLSFDKKVQFYKKWKWVFPAIILPALFYVIWDIYFTGKGVWSFNENYIIGLKLFKLPVEEILFFLVVPYCCVFIYECIRTYFPAFKNNRSADIILQLIALFLFIAGIIFYNKNYTFSAFIMCALFIALIYLFKKFFRNFDSTPFLLSYAVILIPFLIVNGFLTAIPVVLYKEAEMLGYRIYTIPVEDVIYGMLLVLMNISIYERVKSK